jgi:hypothetical protein
MKWMNGIQRFAALAVLVPTLGLGSVACGGDEETIETETGDVSVSQDGEDVHVTARDGQFEGRFGESAELPEGFPDDVPIPDGARVVGAMTSKEPGAEGTLVSIQSDDSTDSLLKAFRAGMDANGWTVDQEMNTMGQRMLQASKGGRSLVVQVMERDGGSHAMVHLGERG